MRMNWSLVAVVGLVVATHTVGAQASAHDSASARVAVTGVAFDSLRGAPLAGAFITLAGNGRPAASTTSDTAGRFHFDSVVPGTYTVAMQHAVFDSIGISGARARVAIASARDTLRLSTPSFARIWRAACGTTPPPADSALVFGTVRSASTRKPLANATVSVRWVDVVADKTSGVKQQPWLAEVRSDSSGDYRACDVPAGSILSVRAATDSSAGDLASGSIDVLPNGERIERRDLLVGVFTDDSASQLRGIIRGVVTTDAGQPVVDARVHTDGVPEVRADSSGRFLIRGVPGGTRQLDAASIGLTPASQVVDVLPHDTVDVPIVLRKVTTLAAMHVKAEAEQRFFAKAYDERRGLGIGYFADSSVLAKRGTLTSAFETVPGVTVDHKTKFSRGAQVLLPTPKGGQCAANIWIDGVRATAAQLSDFGPTDVAALEVYLRRLDTPAEYTSTNGCGAVLLWTKMAFP